jgi:hypothetical protein
MRTLHIAVAALVTIVCIYWLSYLGVQPGPSFEAPLRGWLSTVALSLVGIVPLVGVAISLRSMKSAAFLCFFVLFLLVVWLAGLRLAQAGFPPELQRPSVGMPAVKGDDCSFMCLLLLLPGMFWLAAGKLGWHSPQVGPFSLKLKAAAVTIVILAVMFGVVIMDAYSAESSECHFIPQPFVRQQLSGQSVFTGHLIWTHLVWPSSLITRQQPELFRKYLAIAVVEDKFWGLPKLNRLVLLTYLERGQDHYYEVGRSYFVDGRRASGAIARFLPMFNVFCTRTKLLTDAQVDLRVIRDGPPRDSIRILGETMRASSDYRLQPVSGVTVVIDGPGRTIVKSDKYGVYDAPGLPPGIYQIGLQLEDDEIVWQHPMCIAHGDEQPIRAGDVRDCSIIVR